MIARVLDPAFPVFTASGVMVYEIQRSRRVSIEDKSSSEVIKETHHCGDASSGRSRMKDLVRYRRNSNGSSFRQLSRSTEKQELVEVPVIFHGSPQYGSRETSLMVPGSKGRKITKRDS